MTFDEAKELIPLYALGALDPLTKADFEQEMDHFPPELRDEIVECRAVVSMLPLSLDAPEVSSGVRNRLLKEIGRRPQPLATASPSVLPFKSSDRSAPRPLTDWARWGLLAASIVLTVLTGWLWGENRMLEAESDAMARRATALDEQLARQQAEFDQVVEQTTRLVSLAGQPASPDSQARLLWDTERNIWVIYVFGLPPASTEHDYQLWYITRDQRKISAQVFRPNEHGRSELKVDLPGEIASDLIAAAVTLEPRGGSSQPTGQMYLLASL